MINLAVINLKDITKYFLWIVTLAVIITSFKFFNKINVEKTMSDSLSNYTFVSCLDTTLPDMTGKKNNISSKTTNRTSNLKKFLSVQLPVMNMLIEDEEEEIEEIKKEEVELAKTDVKTEEITTNNISSKYTNTYGSVNIKNESDKEITSDMLIPDVDLDNKKDIVIFHTHTCESYTATEKYNYEMTGTYRTTDLNYTVARVGVELEKQLTNYGYNVIHDQTYHDYPAYSGSYGRSLTTVKNILNSSSADLVIDLHRDAVGSKPDYAPSVKIGDEVAAQMMFVIGTDGGGLAHSGWQNNLKYAIKLQEKANEFYPGLFRPIIVRNSRYNQHLSKAACIIEVGATGNTLEQCLTSMKYLAKILNET